MLQIVFQIASPIISCDVQPKKSQWYLFLSGDASWLPWYLHMSTEPGGERDKERTRKGERERERLDVGGVPTFFWFLGFLPRLARNTGFLTRIERLAFLLLSFSGPSVRQRHRERSWNERHAFVTAYMCCPSRPCQSFPPSPLGFSLAAFLPARGLLCLPLWVFSWSPHLVKA